MRTNFTRLSLKAFWVWTKRTAKVDTQLRREGSFSRAVSLSFIEGGCRQRVVPERPGVT